MSAIWVKFREPGFHCWPNAPQERAYLRNAHRHLFHVCVQCDVKHDNREIEFHDLLDAAREMFKTRLAIQNLSCSCEDMAKALAQDLARRFDRPFAVEVSEDGECGAVVFPEDYK